MVGLLRTQAPPNLEWLSHQTERHPLHLCPLRRKTLIVSQLEFESNPPKYSRRRK